MKSYLKHPLVFYRMPPTRTENALTPLSDAEERELHPALREYLVGAERALAALGFGAPRRASMNGRADSRRAVTLVEHPAEGALGFVVVAQGQHTAPSATAAFRSDFADGTTFQTTNSATISRTPPRPRAIAARFPGVQDVGRLYEIHRFRVAEHARETALVPLTRGADPLAFEAAEARRDYTFWVERGYYRWDGPIAIRLTRRGAVLAAWRGLFPWRQLTDNRHERRAAAILRRNQEARGDRAGGER